ncbi:MAG: NRAMP family divalent metal transporter [Candidatus Kapaibacteriota bacterium]
MRKKILINLFRRYFGPGIITGASDDDPSGIATYSQAGAMFGLATLWTAFIAFPLMTIIQTMCARIGMVTGRGLAGTLKESYPKWVLYITVGFGAPAIVLNIGANIAGMGAVGHMMFPHIDPMYFSVFFTMLLMIFMIYLPYQKITSVLKYACLSLLVYCIVPLYHDEIEIIDILKASFIPTMQFSKDYLLILVGILGTTISPYLFFWQASVEVEERDHQHIIIVDKSHIKSMESDVNSGMLFSGIIMYCIILTTGMVLFPKGITKINTVEDAALALQPLLGNAATLLFSLGVIGTGLIAIPVLSGCLSYMFSEIANIPRGLDRTFQQAKGFYAIMAVSLILGLSLSLFGISPVDALIATAILYGLTAPILIAVILHIANNKDIMGEFTNSKLMNIGGVLTLLLMSASAIALVILSM